MTDLARKRSKLTLTLAPLLALTLLGCTPPPELIGVDSPTTPVASLSQLERHNIFIVTTRQSSEVVGALYSARRAPELGLASVSVSIPPNHVVGRLERPKRLPPDPRSEFAIVDPAIYATDAAFIAGINRELAKRPPAERKLLLFVHGYNNTTSDALLRLGQFVEDTGFKGVPVLFSWASAAKTSRYVYDLNSTLVARSKLTEIADILRRTNARSIDIFAHSMGTFLTMEGLVDAQNPGTLGHRLMINHITLASPDIDIDLFRTQIDRLPPSIREKIYLLISKDDGALSISRRIAGGVPRVGASDAAELEKLGVTVIDLSEIEDSGSGSHSKFAGSPEVVKLIGAGLNSAGSFGDQGATRLDRLLANSPIRIFGN